MRRGEPDPVAATGDPARITVYGSSTCEDTAITTSRLATWRAPHVEVDIDADAVGAKRVVELMGRRVTPTLTVDGTDLAVAEPTLETLGELVRASGAEVAAPSPLQYHGDVVTRSIPIRTNRTDVGESFRLTSLRGRRQAVLFFAHAAACLPCFGYARQLAAALDAADEPDTDVVIVVRDTLDAARA